MKRTMPWALRNREKPKPKAGQKPMGVQKPSGKSTSKGKSKAKLKGATKRRTLPRAAFNLSEKKFNELVSTLGTPTTWYTPDQSDDEIEQR